MPAESCQALNRLKLLIPLEIELACYLSGLDILDVGFLVST
jgi:hypothetical protein